MQILTVVGIMYVTMEKVSVIFLTEHGAQIAKIVMDQE